MLINPNITFEPEGHKYFTKDRQELISVTSIIGLYKKPFDQSGEILKKCAAKKGVSEEELKKEWDKAKIDGCARGTAIHKSIEHFIKTKKVLKDENADIVKQIKKVKFRGLLYSEVLVGDAELGVAGTADLLDVYNHQELDLWDAKTNKRLSSFCPFGNRMLYPLNHLYQTDINVYSLQLSLYAYILERTFGFWVNKLTILWVNPANRKVEVVPIPNKRNDVLCMLDHYRQNAGK